MRHNRVLTRLRTLAQVTETRPDAPTLRDLQRGEPPRLRPLTTAERAAVKAATLEILENRRLAK